MTTPPDAPTLTEIEAAREWINAGWSALGQRHSPVLGAGLDALAERPALLLRVKELDAGDERERRLLQRIVDLTPAVAINQAPNTYPITVTDTRCEDGWRAATDALHREMAMRDQLDMRAPTDDEFQRRTQRDAHLALLTTQCARIAELEALVERLRVRIRNVAASLEDVRDLDDRHMLVLALAGPSGAKEGT